MIPRWVIARERLLDITLAVLCIAAVAPGINAPFIRYDDAYYLTDRAAIFSKPGLAGLAMMWDATRALTGQFFEFFPLRDTVYWLVYQGWGFSPLPYHLTSLLFHLVATLLSLRLAERIGLGRGAAFLTAALFAVHPAHTESVLWAAALKDPMYTSFMFASLLAYARYVRATHEPAWYAASLLFLVGGLMVKSMAVATPVMMALIELLGASKTTWRTAVLRLTGPAAITALFLSHFIVVGQMNSMLVEPHGGSWIGHLVISAWVQVLYLKQAFIPTGFRMIYCFDPPTSWVDGRLVVAVAVLLGLLLLAWRWRAVPIRLFALAWYAVCMLPSANIIPIPPTMDDRFLYAATFGIGVLIASIIVELPVRLGGPTSAFMVLVLLVTSAMTSTAWRDEPMLWADVDEDPACMSDPNPLAATGHLLRAWTEPDRAIALEAYDRAFRSPGLLQSAGNCHTRAEAVREAGELGRYDLADRWALALGRACPYEASTWNALMAVTMHRRPHAAAEAALRAWRLNPVPKAAMLRVVTLAESGNPHVGDWAKNLTLSFPREVCLPLLRWSKEVPPHQVFILRDALSVCQLPDWHMNHLPPWVPSMPSAVSWTPERARP